VGRFDDQLTRRSRRPIVEKLPTLNAHWVQQFIPKTCDASTTVYVQFKIPSLLHLRCYANQVHAEDLAGDIHTVPLRWRYTISGPQLLLVCQCGRKQRMLYCHRNRIACRRCLDCVYVSQTKDRRSRPDWQKAKHKVLHAKPVDAKLYPLLMYVLEHTNHRRHSLI
jgi:hypothetical protein